MWWWEGGTKTACGAPSTEETCLTHLTHGEGDSGHFGPACGLGLAAGLSCERVGTTWATGCSHSPRSCVEGSSGLLLPGPPLGLGVRLGRGLSRQRCRALELGAGTLLLLQELSSDSSAQGQHTDDVFK